MNCGNRTVMTRRPQEIVLVTGVSGFLGQHLLQQLLNDDTVLKIRGLDKKRFCENPLPNTINFKHISEKFEFYHRDLLDIESYRDVVKNVDVVLHCAAMVSYEYPPNEDELYKNNVLATTSLLELCIEEGVSRFVHCSSTEVTEQSCIKDGIFSTTIYGQESKVVVPENHSQLLFGKYAATKLIAENIVLAANGRFLKNGRDTFNTVALRPTLLYGEGDTKLLFSILKEAKKRGNILRKPAGKHQMTYVGNAAWAMVCAKNTLRENPEAVAGLPVIVTDDSIVEDVHRFCEKITRTRCEHRMHFSAWSVPTIVSYIFALLVEFVTKVFGAKKLPISPRSLIAYSTSVFLYNRSRASIYMNYAPKYSADESAKIATDYYCKLLDSE